MKRCWYFITVYYCPACGREKVYRERRYGYRPKPYWKRHNRIEAFDWCDW